MGDTARDGSLGYSGSFPQGGPINETHHSIPKTDGAAPSQPDQVRTAGASAPFFTQYSTLQSPQRMDNPRYPQSQRYAAGGNPSQLGSSFNLNAMSGALPDYGAPATSEPPSQNQNQIQHQQQRRLSGAANPAVLYQLQQNPQYSHQGSGGYPGQGHIGQGVYGSQSHFQSYGQPQGSQISAFPQHASQQRNSTTQQQYGSFSPMSPQYYYFQGATQGYAPMPFNAQGSAMHNPMAAIIGGSQQRAFDGDAQSNYLGVDGYGPRRQSSNTSLSSVPRGPPRKPKQSGHALWVGNLPPEATVLDLKDHFSREATKDIESLFLISKSNCAFVNYRTEAACQAAMQRFHDSRFHGVRLVCRLRRSSVATSGIPTGPAAMAGRRSSAASMPRSPLVENANAGYAIDDQAVEALPLDQPDPNAKVSEKFFVVKSLTLQDLEQSVRNGIWATQSHNEQTLNKAFSTADNVYLIFSANKSGEYFGYARMLSPINENAAEIMRSLPKDEHAEASDAPKTIPTAATEWSPRGKIIDDSARGTIFWEAEHSDDEEEAEKAADTEAVDGEAGSSQVWGKPFKIEWLSTNRLPFYRTRGLRNPWNANREVKIARDGTELETSVGKRLVQMFHRPGPAAPAQAQMLSGLGAMPVHMGGPSPMGGPQMPY